MSEPTHPPAPSLPRSTLSIDTIRTLAIDAVQKANSGHPGAPMALAPVAYTLWNRYLRYDPAHPHWPNRDRSCSPAATPRCCSTPCCTSRNVAEKDGGNAPAVSLDEIKRFRQIDSRTPGHPEYHFTTGVETTPGAGPGRRHSVGMAMGGRFMGRHLNRRAEPLRLQRLRDVLGRRPHGGRRSEAASIAGHLRLSNCAGSTTTTPSPSRATPNSPSVRRHPLLAYGWEVVWRVADATTCTPSRPPSTPSWRTATGRRSSSSSR